MPWLKDARYALPSLIMMSFWSVGHTVVIMLAAMQEVPTSLYEAADIDGATLLQKVRHITVPMIAPVLYFNTILGIIGVVQVFATPYIITTGGPRGAPTSTRCTSMKMRSSFCVWDTPAPWRGSSSRDPRFDRAGDALRSE